MRPRFRENPVSSSFVRLVDVIYGVTLAQALVIHREKIADLRPLTLMATLALIYVTVILSWDGYHRSILKYPYNESRWSFVRLWLDVFILIVYAYLAFAANELPKVVMGLAVVFLLYAIDGCTRILEWRDEKVSKPWLSVSYSAGFVLLWWAGRTERLGTWSLIVISLILVCSFRFVRAALGYPRMIVVGVDVDGVLAEQIPHLIQHLQTKKGIATSLTKNDVVEWAFKIDGTDIAAEMEEALLEPTFVRTMPVVAEAADGMSQLHKQMHVVIATSRPLDSQDATVEWLNSHFKCHEVVNTRQRGKSAFGLHVLVDDNIDNVKSFVRGGGVFSQPWNREAERDQELESG